MARRLLLLVVLGVGLAAAGPAAASARHEHDPQSAGHPVRIVAYALYPVGLLLDTVLFRPADWLVSHEPFATIFGHEDP